MTIGWEGFAPEEETVTETVVGVRLKGWRLIRGMSLDELSDCTKIPIGSLEIYERGRRMPGGMRMLVIMRELRLTPDDLLHEIRAEERAC